MTGPRRLALFVLLALAPAARAAVSEDVEVRLPDFARGPGQTVDVPADHAGLPVELSDGGGARAVSLTIVHDPALLSIETALPGASLARGSEVHFEAAATAPGALRVHVTSAAPLPRGRAELVRLRARVPSAARYASVHRIAIADASIDRGAVSLAARGASSLHLVAYAGDATASGAYSALDAALVLRAGRGLDARFAAYPDVSPRLLADVSGDGAVDRADARLVLAEAAGIDVPEVPALPGVLAPSYESGPDPRVDIPRDLAGSPGGTVTAPVRIDTAQGLLAVDLQLEYDTALLDVPAGTGVRTGEVMDDPQGLIVSNLQEALGRLTVAIAVTTPRGDVAGSILDVDYAIDAAAPEIQTPLNLVRVSLNEDGLVLDPVPQPLPDDATDGLISITAEPAPPSFVRGDPNADGRIDLTDGIVILNFLFLGGPAPACADAGDTDDAGDLAITDAVIVFSYLFLGGPPPRAPSPSGTTYAGSDCAEDPTEADALGCERFAPCRG